MNNNKNRNQPLASRVKEVKVPASVNPVKSNDLKLNESTGLKSDCFIISVTGPKGYSHTITVHRPIGSVPGAEEGDWVMSPSSEVEYLLAGSEDPDSEKRAIAVQKNLMKAAILEKPALGKLILSEEGTLAYDKGFSKDKTRAEVLSEARSTYKEHLAEARAAYRRTAMHKARSELKEGEVFSEEAFLKSLSAYKNELKENKWGYLDYVGDPYFGVEDFWKQFSTGMKTRAIAEKSALADVPLKYETVYPTGRSQIPLRTGFAGDLRGKTTEIAMNSFIRAMLK